MNLLLAILVSAFSTISTESVLSYDFVSMIESLTSTTVNTIENGFTGYNPYLSSDQVLHFYCAKPSDKVFNKVNFNDTDMATKLDLTKPIGFCLHGWIDSASAKWVKELTQTWVDNHNTNVCRVDWSIYSLVEYGVAAKRNVGLVSRHLFKFIKNLHDLYNVAYSNVTLIGHSLGAQISGVTGYFLGGQIGRIIAMDPAAPFFNFPVSVPLEDQLDKTDARFVTVVHSNNHLFGIGHSIGHADYYPNGVIILQPGCTFPLIFGNYAVDVTPNTCSHFRAIRFVHLALVINPLCRGIKCDTYMDYLTHSCTNTTDSWGIESSKIEGDFYFWSGMNPTCTGKYYLFDE